MHNMNYEKKFIESFDYNLIGPDNSNRWKILDDKNNEIGFIQYKKIYGGNKKKGYPKEYGYEMQIDNGKIIYYKKRKITKDENNIYNFYVNGNKHVELKLDSEPSIAINKNNSTFISFNINAYGLYINLLTEGDNYKVNQSLKYENVNDNNNYKQYSYVIRYCDKDHDLFDSRDGITSRQLFIMKDKDEEKIRISQKEYINRRLESTSAKIVDGNFEEAIKKHQMGIECFNEIRTLTNELLPMDKDVISQLLNEDIINNYNLSMFVENSKNVQRVLNK